MNAFLNVSLSCALCDERKEWDIDMPPGWDSRYHSVSDETAFCPEHAIVAKFADSQCPGCVGGWGDCDLYRSFAYSEMLLTTADLRTLASGVCPKRTNGTMCVTRSASGATIEDIDLRDAPVAEAGKVLATAIQQYALKYHKNTGT